MSLFVRKSENVTASQWTIETLREHVIALLAAHDLRYSQRFDASQQAIKEAFSAQQTAMNTALTAQKLSVDAALEAAKTAVNKAEIATEKRFESVNEFRAQLSDQTKSFPPRAEIQVVVNSLQEKIDALTKDIANLREYRSQATGKGEGANALWGYLAGAAGIAFGIISVVTR